MTDISVTQPWPRVKMRQDVFYAKIRANPLAEPRRLGQKIEVFVAGKLVSVYYLPTEVLAYMPKNGQVSKDPPPPSPATKPDPSGASTPSTVLGDIVWPPQVRIDAGKIPPPQAIADLRRTDDGRPLCPKCQKVMQVKFNVKAKNAFWSCSGFGLSQCRGTRRFNPHPDDLTRAGGLHYTAIAYSLERYLGGDFSHLYNVQDGQISSRRRVRAFQVTDRTLVALNIIVLFKPTACEFKAKMWPDSPGNSGYVSQLVTRGLVLLDGDRYRLSIEGDRIIQQAIEDDKL